jgi:phosphoserine aminotransferase
MPAREDVHYFGAGPAPLPTSVLEEASKTLLNYNNSGIGITEISHRSPEANAILAHTQSGLRQLLDIPESDGPDGYQILFLQGGGSGEFSAVVYHMISIWVAAKAKEVGNDEEKLRDEVKKMKLDYLVTGSWSLKASQEAARLAGPEHVNIVTDSRKHNDGKFGKIASPDTYTPTASAEDTALTYYCDNETVDGVEFPSAPNGANLVADMSSNFLSRAVDVRKHAAIFGGAQKNIGTTGITIAIISNKILPPNTPMADPVTMQARPAHRPCRPRLAHDRQEQQPVQHAPHLRRLDRGSGHAEAARHLQRCLAAHCRAASRIGPESRRAVRRARRQRRLPRRAGQERAQQDESVLPHQGRRRRRREGFPQGRREQGSSRPEGPPQRGRHSVQQLQCRPCGGC